jgi:hypothetical protein
MVAKKGLACPELAEGRAIAVICESFRNEYSFLRIKQKSIDQLKPIAQS